MKTHILWLTLLCSQLVWAVPKGATCVMHSRGNEAQIVLEVTGDKVTVKVGEATADECQLAEDRNYDLLARCDDDEEATFFGVRRNSGRVFSGSDTVAELKNCRLQN